MNERNPSSKSELVVQNRGLSRATSGLAQRGLALADRLVTDPVGQIQRSDTKGFIHCVVISPDGRRIASASTVDASELGGVAGTEEEKNVQYVQYVQLWDVETGHEVCSFTHYSSDVAFSLDSELLLIGRGEYFDGEDWIFDDAMIRVFQVQDGHEVSSFDLPHYYHDNYCFTDFHVTIAVGTYGWYALLDGNDGIGLVWDLKNSKPIAKLVGHRSIVGSMALSATGEYALSGGSGLLFKNQRPNQQRPPINPILLHQKWIRDHYGGDTTVRLWDICQQRELRCFVGHTRCVDKVAFSPNQRHVLSVSSDNTIRLWDIETGQEIHRFSGNTGALSHDGQRIITSDYAPPDEIVQIWDVRSGQEICRFYGHTDTVSSVTFAHDGRSAITGSRDRTIRVWRLPP